MFISSGHLPPFPFILYSKGSRIEDLIDRYFAEISFRPKVIMTFDNAEAIEAMIWTGLGISMLPMWTVDGDLKRGAVADPPTRAANVFESGAGVPEIQLSAGRGPGIRADGAHV